MARLRLQAPVRRPSSKDAQDPVNIQNIWDFNELKYKGRQILLLRTKVCGTPVLFLHLPRYSGFKDKKTLASSQLLPIHNALRGQHFACMYATQCVSTSVYYLLSCRYCTTARISAQPPGTYLMGNLAKFYVVF